MNKPLTGKSVSESNYCRHYNGRGALSKDGFCKVGVTAEKFGPPFGSALRRPCVDSPSNDATRERANIVIVPCEQRSMYTPEERAQQKADMDHAMKRVMAGLKIAAEWRVKGKPPTDRRGVVECPECKGKLHLSQSGYNGHVHGQCETPNCMSWME